MTLGRTPPAGECANTSSTTTATSVRHTESLRRQGGRNSRAEPSVRSRPDDHGGDVAALIVARQVATDQHIARLGEVVVEDTVAERR